MQTISGVVRNWTLDGNTRTFLSINYPFGVARMAFKGEVFDSRTNKGEQRKIVPDRVRKIQKATREGTYTPTQVHAGVRSPRQLDAIVYTTADGVRTASLTLDECETIPLTNGGHRFASWEALRAEAEECVARSDEGPARESASRLLGEIDSLPVDICVMLDGDTQEDFINLQNNKSVDTAQMLSLRVHRGMLTEKERPAMEMALLVAKLLNADRNCDFYRNIRFDSVSCSNYPITSLLSRTSSDLSTSFYGLAKVGIAAGWRQAGERLAQCVAVCLKEVIDHAPGLADAGKILTPPPEGTKGAATMYIGMAACMAYRLMATKGQLPTVRDKASLLDAARTALDHPVDGNFSGPQKRKYMGAFARAFFADLKGTVEMYQGVPRGLIEILPTASYGLDAIPAAAKKKAAAPAKPKPKRKAGAKKAAGWATPDRSADLSAEPAAHADAGTGVPS